MAQDLTTSSPVGLPAIDTRNPGSLLLLPEWLAQQLGAVSDLGAGRTEVDPVTRTITRRAATILKSKMPTGPQRRAIQRRIDDLHEARKAGPDEETINIIGDLLTEYAPSRPDEDVTTVKANAYLDALEDLPAWAIREALRRWRRGEVVADKRDLDFAPRPHRIRGIAEGIARVATGQALRLQRLLDAEPEEAPSAEQRERTIREARAEMDIEPGSGAEPVGVSASERASAQRDLDRMEEAARVRDAIPASAQQPVAP